MARRETRDASAHAHGAEAPIWPGLDAGFLTSGAPRVLGGAAGNLRSEEAPRRAERRAGRPPPTTAAAAQPRLLRVIVTRVEAIDVAARRPAVLPSANGVQVASAESGRRGHAHGLPCVSNATACAYVSVSACPHVH